MSTLRMQRAFPVPPAMAFEFITQKQNLLTWWGPEGTTITENDLDFSRVGPWSATMVGPQGHGANVGGEVLAVEPPDFVELTLSFFGPDGTPMDLSTIRFETRDDGKGGTDFHLIQSGLKAEYIPDMRDKGWNSALTRLEALLTSN